MHRGAAAAAASAVRIISVEASSRDSFLWTSNRYIQQQPVAAAFSELFWSPGVEPNRWFGLTCDHDELAC